MARPQRALVAEICGRRERRQPPAGPGRRTETSLTEHVVTRDEGRKDAIPRGMKGTLTRTYGVKVPFMRRGFA
jgi:hypothetical protein